jgi:hypothetical protein
MTGGDGVDLKTLSVLGRWERSNPLGGEEAAAEKGEANEGRRRRGGGGGATCMSC